MGSRGGGGSKLVGRQVACQRGSAGDAGRIGLWLPANSIALPSLASPGSPPAPRSAARVAFPVLQRTENAAKELALRTSPVPDRIFHCWIA